MNWAKAVERYRHLFAGRAVTSLRVFHTWQRFVLRQSSIAVAATYKHSMCLSSMYPAMLELSVVPSYLGGGHC